MPAFPKLSTTNRPAFRRALGAWFENNKRALPWRTEPSLYRTVVSEFMLQQTQIATALPYFDRWMRELPDFPTLAAANEERVLKLWEGLGYYRRARFLHRLARRLVEIAEPPGTAAGWRELPGIGPYTAAAIASLAFGDPVACVDGNVVRILARLTGDTREFSDSSRAAKNFEPLAAWLLDVKNPARHNEAMMELGATICVRRNPRCERCPVARFCLARRKGIAADLPRISRPETTKQEVARAWVVHRRALLLHRGNAGARRFDGLLELPNVADLGIAAVSLTDETLLATHRRSITRFQITEHIHRIHHALVNHTSDPERFRWVPLDRLDTVTLSGPHRRWVTALLRPPANELSRGKRPLLSSRR